MFSLLRWRRGVAGTKEYHSGNESDFQEYTAGKVCKQTINFSLSLISTSIYYKQKKIIQAAYFYFNINLRSSDI